MATREKPIKVLIAKTSIDGHWRGVAIVTAALRDSGMEVVYGGQLTAEEIAAAAVQEGVDVVGLHIGGRLGTVQRVMETLQGSGLHDVLVVGGGSIAPEDIPVLKEMGIAGVFPPGSQTDAIVSFVRDNVSKKERETD